MGMCMYSQAPGMKPGVIRATANPGGVLLEIGRPDFVQRLVFSVTERNGILAELLAGLTAEETRDIITQLQATLPESHGVAVA